MAWNQLDFEREVRRQLIVLRSLRKRIPENEDLLQRIERLEASHHGLLRRLGDLFVEPPAASRKAAVRCRTGDERLSTGDGARGADFPRLTVLEEPDDLEGQELCPRCGRLLLPSLLSGERVVQLDRSWLHASCLENSPGEGERQYGPL